MFIPKDLARQIHRFHQVNPEELETFEEWAEWLEALLHNPCSILERDGELILLEIKQLVARINGLKIEVYADEHPPPHFHVKAPDINVSFSIEDCSLLKGKISAGAEQKVRYWHRHSKATLIEAWNSTRPSNCTVGLYSGA